MGLKMDNRTGEQTIEPKNCEMAGPAGRYAIEIQFRSDLFIRHLPPMAIGTSISS
jgi:hypothetical protein